jgi:hypothetical protein
MPALARSSACVSVPPEAVSIRKASGTVHRLHGTTAITDRRVQHPLHKHCPLAYSLLARLIYHSPLYCFFCFLQRKSSLKVVVFLHGGGNRLNRVSNGLGYALAPAACAAQPAGRPGGASLLWHASPILASTIPSAGSICSPPTRAGTYAPHVLRPSIAQEVSVHPPARSLNPALSCTSFQHA